MINPHSLIVTGEQIDILKSKNADLEERLKVAEDAIKYAQKNISWAEGKRRYHEQNEYYSEAIKRIRGEK